jgi:hypothetical protein
VTSLGCKVYRGPFVTGDPGKALFVGYDGDPAGEFRSVASTSEWAGLGARARDEMFDVACSITVLSGDANVEESTNEAYAVHTAYEAALRADPSLNQAPRLTAAITTGELFTIPHPAGLQVRLSFAVRVSARI